MQRSLTEKARRTAMALVLGLTAMLLVTPAAAADLPTAREVVDRFVAATGGELLLKRQSMTSHSTLKIPAQGLEGTVKTWIQAPDRMAMEMEIPGYGKVRTGYDGQVGWMVDPAMGAQLLTDKSLAQLGDQSNFYGQLYRPEDLESLTMVGVADFQGTACHEVRVVTGNGLEAQHFFAVDSGLLVGMQQTQHTPMGAIPSTTALKEYREFDGVQMATLMEQSMMGMQQIVTIDAVSFEPIDAAVFALPVDIEALLETAE
jgi:outer membrane lipoprotein-sorting protein